MNQQIMEGIYRECFKDSLQNKANRINATECFKQKVAIFRDIIQILNAPMRKQ